MNKGIYRLVWNNSQGALQVVSETAKTRTCSGSGTRASTGLRKATVWPLALLSLSMATCAVAVPGYGVTTDADSGTGSLREGLASGGYLMVDPSITSIALSSDAAVLHNTTLNVTGPLTVTGASLAGSGSALVLNGTSAGRLTIAISGQFMGRASDVGSATNGVAGTAGVGPGDAGGAGGNGTLLAPVTGAFSGVSGSFFDLTNNRLVSGGYGMSVLSAGNGGAGGVGARGSFGSPGGTGGTGGSGGAGANGGNGAAGGAGVSGNNFTLTNNDTIYGGIGASGTNGGAGGAGGAGGDYGGDIFDEGGDGGRGGNGGNGGNGGAGGAGVSGYAMQVFNTGMIVGGDGGRAGSAGAAGLGGNAGNSDFSLNVPGANGSGGSAGSAGAGGVGIISTGNSTIRNAGAIAGGLANQSTGPQANAIEFSGGGNILILEAGSEILGNVVSTSGGTDTLALGGNVNALSNGFNLSDLGTQYQGFDSFQKLGTSTWTLTGTDTVSRIWDVQAGTLVLEDNTQLAGALGLRNDGTLSSGTASIGGGVINAGHLNIADGATLSLGSGYTQGSHGTLSIGALSTSQYGKLAITGNATLAGGLDVDVKSGNTLAANQQLLNVITTTGHITGTFDSVSDNSLLFNFTPSYTSNSVSLDIVAAGGGSSGNGNGNTAQGSVQALGNTPGRGAARVLDGVIAGNPSGRLAGYFVPLSTQGEVSQAVSETLPLMAGGSTESARTALSGINGVIQGRSEAVRGLSSGDATFTDQHGWIKPFGSWADQESRGGVAGVNTSVGGLAFGLDASLNDRWLLGTAFIYANVNTRNSGDTARQQLKTDVYQLVGYGSYHLDDRTDLNFQLDAGQNHNKGTRDIDFVGLQAKSNYDSWTAHAGVSLDRTFTLTEQTRFIPSVRADYTWIKDEAYREKGAEDLNLSAKSRSTDQFILGVDGKLSHDLTQQLNVSANLGVGYDFLAERDSISSSFAGAPGASFTTYSGDPQRWLVRGGTGLNYQVNGQLQLGVRYDLEKRTDYLNQTGSVEARWAF